MRLKTGKGFTLAEGGHSPLLCATKGAQSSSIKSLSLRERVMAVARQGLTATGEGAGKNNPLAGSPLTCSCKPHSSATTAVLSRRERTCAFTLAEGGHSPLLCGDEGVDRVHSCTLPKGHKFHHASQSSSPRLVKRAFTLAEVLITLGVIGVVAAVTMPTLVTNIQERVRKEQVRTVKYKLTKATDKMKSLDKIGNYDSTEAFVNELKNHLSIAKICNSGNLTECWPTEKFNTVDGEKTVSTLTTGSALTALAVGSGNRTTMGIVTGDGVPMILVYAKNCIPLDPAKSYTWSVVDGKPETNATTNCVSAIFDINGAKGPNKIGQDVRTLNSLMGYKRFTEQKMSYDDCMKQKDKLGINECCPTCDANGGDAYAGAVEACADIGLHLPSLQTLANLAGAVYGRTDIGTYTLIMKNGFTSSNGTTYPDCHGYFNANNWNNRVQKSDQIICTDGNIPTDVNTPIPSALRSGYFWSSTEVSARTALIRNIISDGSSWYEGNRYNGNVPLCVGD